MSSQTNTIKDIDIKKIYLKIQNEKSNSFYVKIQNKGNEISSQDQATVFYDKEIIQGRDTQKLLQDAEIAKNIAKELIF